MHTRRTFLRTSAAAGGGVALLQTGCSTQRGAGAAGTCPTTVVVSDANAIVETASGKIRGYTRNGIHTFRGIPYGATTEGAARWMPAAKPKPWTGIRSCMYYGPTCPQGARMGWANDENAFLFQWDDGQFGEDCLRVNVWTPGLNDNKKRPVMVWLHGGGYQAGSGQEQPAYNGENLARRGDVVVVSLNHRLGVLGYLNLSEFGEPYAHSANLGQLDLVAALEWVRDHAAAFGGDAGNVLIFGQSGGGGKVTVLMGMPAAKGLFHKAVVQSGSLLSQNQPADSAKLAGTIVAELGLNKAQIAKMHELPVAKLIEAGAAAVRKLTPPPKPGATPALKLWWGPTADGKDLPEAPFGPNPPAISANIPMIIGTTLNEFSASASNPQAELMTEEELKKNLAGTYGEKAGRILDAAKKIYPGVKPVELSSIIGASMFRGGAVLQAERKAAQGRAPAYMYQFCWKTPILDGRPRAFHCAEIPFVFYNTDVSAFATGGGDRPRQLAAKVSDAWINFARKGDPNHSGLPTWPAFKPQPGPTMIFDDTCEVKNDPDAELRKAMS